MYVEMDRESDGHVLRYKWLNEKVRPVHPHYYYLYHCPHCYFTDITTDYKNPRENPHFQLAERSLRKVLEKEKATMAYLASRVSYQDLSFEGALALHYLGAFIQMLLPLDGQDNLKIGRLMLRIAWLFREQSPAEEGEIKDPIRRDALSAVESFEGELQQLIHHWQKTSQALAPQIGSGERETASNGANPLRHHRDTIEKLLEAQISEVYRLKAYCKSDPASAAPDSTHTLQDFLATVKSQWPMAPVDETEAVRMSVAYLENAVSRDATFDNPQAHLNGISLIIDLLIRSGDVDGAFGMVRGIYRNATVARGALQEKLHKPDLDETAKQRIRNKMRELSRSVEHAGEIRRKLLGMLIERDRDVIRRAIAENAGAPADKTAAALEQNGISPGVVAFLKERGDLDPKKTKG
jgi:tRNA-dihydrouridine synthase